MIRSFSPKTIDSYLELELRHSLDCFRSATNGSKKEKPDSAESFLSLMEQFYKFLAELRYSIALPIQNDSYENYVNAKYSDFIDKIDRLILSACCRLNKNDKREMTPDLQAVDSLEALIIYQFYHCVESNISKAMTRSQKKIAIKERQKIDADPTSIAIETRFITNNKLEVSNRLHYRRLLQNKLQRYGGNDRAGYWKGLIYNDDIISDNIRNWFVNFMTNENNKISNDGNLFAMFSLLILTKYHVVLHRYAHGAYEFRTLKQHEDSESSDIKKRIKRAQKVFTFTKLIAKYFSYIFVKNQKHSDVIAKTIEILSYIRRGSAFSSLNQMEMAFNDFTGAEKQLRSLRGMHKNHTSNTITSCYYSLILPYVFSLKGEVYRRNHAFYNAHQYYSDAISIYENGIINYKNEILTLQETSLKIVRIKMANAKSIFELGQFRKSLKWYLKALDHLLKILGLAKGHITTKFDNLFSYLEEAHFDPKLIKCDLSEKLAGVTNELGIILNKKNKIIANYGILLSDLLTRISLIVFLLKIPDYNSDEVKVVRKKDNKCDSFKNRKDLRKDVPRNQLAWELILLALHLNHGNSLAIFNNLAFGTESMSGKVKIYRSNILEELRKAPADLMEFGGLRSILYRNNAKKVLECLGNGGSSEQLPHIARVLLQKLLLHTEDFSVKNDELHKYLMKKPHEDEKNITATKKDTKDRDIYIYVLQRWSSINPALPRPSAFKIKGGGYFIVFKGKGIAIDPGLNFIDNLYAEGFSIADIDYIIATHDHIDHTADIDTILSLHYRRSKLESASMNKCINLLLNPSVSSRYNHILQQDPGLCRKIELTRDMNMPLEGFEGDLIIEPKKAIHPDLSSPNPNNSIGIVLVFYPKHKTKETKIGIMSDTQYDKDIMNKYTDVDIIITHINSATFKELTRASGVERPDIFNGMSINGKECKMGKEIDYSLGYLDNGNNHMCLEGVVNAYSSFASNNMHANKKKLFVISEISEEMGSYRHKIAALLNESKNPKVKCLTADIGMAMRVDLKPTMHNQRIQVRCSRCNLNNDYTDDDKFHSPENIKEFCIKREEEGIFYYCPHHDPEGFMRDDIEQYGFVERIERYQPFKHTDVYTL